jgi:hypothetical protein
MVIAMTNALVTATGNNLVVKGDATRRAVVGRLDPKVERPELRSFNYDPIADAKQNRGELVVAVLTILKAYHNAGLPSRPPPLQSFVDWSDTVRGALLWLGQGDPVNTMRRLRATDPTLVNLKAVLTAWRDQFGDEATSSAVVVAKAEETISFEKDVGGNDRIRLTPTRHCARPCSWSRARAAELTFAPSANGSANRPVGSSTSARTERTTSSPWRREPCSTALAGGGLSRNSALINRVARVARVALFPVPTREKLER